MADEPKQIPIGELGVEQLNQLVKQVEGELAFFTESSNSLKVLAEFLNLTNHFPDLYW